jgi:hypothetical protein
LNNLLKGKDSTIHSLDLDLEGLPNATERKTASEHIICLDLQLCIIGSNHRSFNQQVVMANCTISPLKTRQVL